MAGFQIRNVAVVSGQTCTFTMAHWDIFRGTVATAQVSTQTTTETILDVTCVDLNDMLDKRCVTRNDFHCCFRRGLYRLAVH